MIRTDLTLALAVLLAGAAGAVAEEPAGTVTVKISRVQTGLFLHEEHRAIGTRIPQRLSGPRIVRSTRGIPMERGSTFGVRLRIDADRGEMLQLASIWTFVRDVGAGETPTQVMRARQHSLVRNHRDTYVSYALDDARDVTPGLWALDIVLIGVDEDRMAEGAEDPPYWIPLYDTTFRVDRPALGAPGDWPIAVEPGRQ